MDKYKVINSTAAKGQEVMNDYAKQGYVVKTFATSVSPGYFYCLMELPDALYKPDPTTDTHSAFDEPEKAPEVKNGTCPVEGCEENIGHKSVIRFGGEVFHI